MRLMPTVTAQPAKRTEEVRSAAGPILRDRAQTRSPAVTAEVVWPGGKAKPVAYVARSPTGGRGRATEYTTA